VQGVLEFLLVLLGQRGLQDGAAVLAHRLEGLVRRRLLQHQEQRGRARLDQIAYLVAEFPVDTGLGQLAHEGAHARADGHAEHRDEEQQAEQEAPEHAPHRAAADRVMGRVDVVAAFLVPGDHGDRVGLDDQVSGEASRLVGRGGRGRLVWVTDCDQGCHAMFSFLCAVHIRAWRRVPAPDHSRDAPRRTSPAARYIR